MGTSLLIAETLLNGMVAVIWMYPLYSTSPLAVSSNLFTGASAEIRFLLAVSLVYVAGTMVSLVSDLALGWLDRFALRGLPDSPGKRELQSTRTRLALQSQSGLEYNNQRRSLVRVWRGTTFNVLAMGIVASTVIRRHLVYELSWPLGRTIALMVVAVLVSGFGYFRALRGYYRFLSECSDYLEGA